MIATAAVLISALASPQFGPVGECGRLEPLRWQSWLYRDAGEGLFEQEAFLPETRWVAPPEDTTGNRLVGECFGVPAPHSRDVVVHHYPPAALTPPRTRPVLLITGAGDNALRSMSFLAVALSRSGFHSYALTFAHRHGDNFQHAEHVANALAVIAERHPGVLIDLLAYSKGGVAARIYLSNGADADWAGTHEAYQRHGTRYRGDVGRVILLGTPNAGMDTLFRWTASNLMSVGPGPLPDAPTAWTWYLPTATDLRPRSVFREGGDHFPGQRQLLADLRARHPLPGGNPTLGLYGAQPDYLSTYDGWISGGLVSRSPGLAAAVAEGGDTIGRLQSLGVDPELRLYVAAGGNPILSVGSLQAEMLEAYWGDQTAAERRQSWESLVEGGLAGHFPWWSEAFADDLPRLFAGTAFLGEISGPSDGLLFVSSAQETGGLTLRGAQVVESRLFAGLSHAELPAAGLLAADFYGDAELAGGLHDDRLAAKYRRAENQSVEWVLRVLSEPVPESPPEPPWPDGGVDEDAGGADGGPSGSDADPSDMGEAPRDAGLDAGGDAEPGEPTNDATQPPADASGGGGGQRVDAGGEDATANGGPQRSGDRFGGSCQAAAPAGGRTGTSFGVFALLFLALPWLRRARLGLIAVAVLIASGCDDEGAAPDPDGARDGHVGAFGDVGGDAAGSLTDAERRTDDATPGGGDARPDGGGRSDGETAPDDGVRDGGPLDVDAGEQADAGEPPPGPGGRWEPRANLAGGPRQECPVVRLGDEVVVVGGFDGRAAVVSTVEAYDPGRDAWRSLPDLPVAMHHAQAAVVGDRLFVLGFLTGLGFNADGRGYVLEPGANAWRPVAPMPARTERGGGVAVENGGEIYVVGGFRGRRAVPEFSVYSPATDTWAPLPSLPFARDHHVAAALDGQIYLVGGRDAAIESHTAAVYAYDPGRREWRERAPMPTSRGGAMAAVAGGRLYVMGGEGSPVDRAGVYPQVEAYDPVADRWEVLPPMRTPRHGTGAATVGGWIYVPGGADVQAFGAVRITEAYAFPR